LKTKREIDSMMMMLAK